MKMNKGSGLDSKDKGGGGDPMGQRPPRNRGTGGPPKRHNDAPQPAVYNQIAPPLAFNKKPPPVNKTKASEVDEKAEKIREKLRVANSKDALEKVISEAKSQGFNFEAGLGERKLAKLESETAVVEAVES
eukprot:Platyproteum_vivax@DN6387_c0_g1_i1.p2